MIVTYEVRIVHHEIRLLEPIRYAHVTAYPWDWESLCARVTIHADDTTVNGVMWCDCYWHDVRAVEMLTYFDVAQRVTLRALILYKHLYFVCFLWRTVHSGIFVPVASKGRYKYRTRRSTQERNKIHDTVSEQHHRWFPQIGTIDCMME